MTPPVPFDYSSLLSVPLVSSGVEDDGGSHPLVRKLAAGYLECLILQKSTTIIVLWRTPQHLLDDRSPIVDKLVEHLQEASMAAGPLARRAVHAGMQEAREFTDLDQRIAALYADAILQRLEWARGPRTGEVIDIETLRLIRAGRDAQD